MMIEFKNSYEKLPQGFFNKVTPSAVRDPKWIHFNVSLAKELGLDVDKLQSDEGLRAFSGNSFPSGASSIAMAYAGHQFGHFVPSLGDGRAILMGEVIDRSGKRYDIHLKGSGPTPFSRRGDGRAALGPVIREFIMSEAMHALGIATTRTLAAVTTGERVFREVDQKGAVLTRVAASHIRIGTFEYFAARGDLNNLKILADYAIQRHYPNAKSAENPHAAFFEEVVRAQAKLISQWLLVGFIHGVMNTDNMTISGETIDYGPCAFMDEYDPATVFSSIDRNGRYAYGAQAQVGQWNLACLAQSLLPLFSESESEAIAIAEKNLHLFSEEYERHWRNGFGAKLGIKKVREDDKDLFASLLSELHEKKMDYTNAFLELENVLQNKSSAVGVASSVSKEWITRWRARLRDEGLGESASLAIMQEVNPVYIPRNHQVAKAISAAEKNDDYSVMDKLMIVLAQPFVRREGYDEYMLSPKSEERVLKTFCGT